MSRIYESGEYYQKVKEIGNGLEREYLEEEKWRRGDQFEDKLFNRRISPLYEDSSRFSQPSSFRNTYVRWLPSQANCSKCEMQI
ncbi:unnamed protein product [Toxocara canis]|uniref:Uncharacterized protein n=1 Tax=Toxocara canis TaxID=6265 RepID=A0A183VAG3_TOXCA|nr:unnamed protein product [Toxocara canis]